MRIFVSLVATCVICTASGCTDAPAAPGLTYEDYAAQRIGLVCHGEAACGL